MNLNKWFNNFFEYGRSPFKRQPHKKVKHTYTIRQQKPTNCLSVFDHIVGSALKGLRYCRKHIEDPVKYL